jgi:hypothetical protein
MSEVDTYPVIEIADAPTELVDMDSIHEHPSNPRYHSRQQVEELAASLKDHGYAGITLTVSTQTRNIVKGNGMYSALQLCGCKKVRVVLKDMDMKEELQFLIRDNRLSELSSWDKPMLDANICELQEMGVELQDVGFTLEAMEEVENRYQSRQWRERDNSVGGEPQDPNELWEGMPEFEQENAGAVRTIKIHFQRLADVDEFSELIGQKITDRTKYINFPELDRLSTEYTECIDDESQISDIHTDKESV